MHETIKDSQFLILEATKDLKSEVLRTRDNTQYQQKNLVYANLEAVQLLETNFDLNDEQHGPSTGIPLAVRCADLELVDLRDESFNYLENVQNMEMLNYTVNSINNGILEKNSYIYLIKDNVYKTGSFRILPKIQKDKFGIRPIIYSINHPNCILSLFIDQFLQPLVKECGTVIKDSQEVLQILNEATFNMVKIFKHSCDFESLYTNIDPDHAIDALCDFLLNTNFNCNDHLDIVFILYKLFVCPWGVSVVLHLLIFIYIYEKKHGLTLDEN
ncbi:unnamed protein product [Brachionus calyciflorus]|uniref:Uncharacterized protein n=1 Tax=Brachionus calyciflorus TaxID=104777 RepID=A0A814H6F6_9BILA|nr:unnamed protein product [Brachionus calyciflorus]